MAQKKIKVKPGKTESKIGFVVGILFVILGVVVVIPIFGVFGIIWTGVAVMIAFTHYKNGFSDEGVATHEIIIEDGMGITKRNVDGEDIEVKLMKLNSLYEQRLISKEEYDEKRKKLLDEFLERNDMTEQEKLSFQKVIVTCVIGAILILIVPIVFRTIF